MGKTNINTTVVNNYYINNTDIKADYFQGLRPERLKGVKNDLMHYFDRNQRCFDNMDRFRGNQDFRRGGCVMPPRREDCCHPQGSMKTDGNTITTPGGYKIEATGQFEWKITGPDGKSTRVWGDPHVAEGDGGTWDFKRNSTFVLGDGTKVNVTTAPWGKGGMTVTQGLEVINGNERVTVSGIDKGKGVVGKVTQDGYAHTNTFQGSDVFVMGKETDDWSHQGREIIGSNNGGDSFKLGKELAAGNTNDNRYRPYNDGRGFNNPRGFEDFAQMLRSFVDTMISDWKQQWSPNPAGQNPYNDGLSNRNDFFADNTRRDQRGYNCPRHQNNMRQMFGLLTDMYRLLSRYSGMNDQMFANRNRMMTA